MENINVGLLGAVINNGNMGCVALTYSLVSLLEHISEKVGYMFIYYIFEEDSDRTKTDYLCKEINIESKRITTVKITTLCRMRSIIHHPYLSKKAYEAMCKCDFFIDLTYGDSFSDIYGQWRFDSATHIKKLVLKMKKPLILGPQTYGPFNHKKNLNQAVKIIEEAICVISRDQMSAEYLSKYTDKRIFVTTDLAFGLPYNIVENMYSKMAGNKIKVGINISALLVKKKEEPTEIRFKLKTDYDLYIHRLLEFLDEGGKYEIHCIPHVGDDAGGQFKSSFKNVVYHSQFSNPVEAKNCISQMDIFIGARMHATIGAFSSGVATIPTAYSRKFIGLFKNLGYPFVVDLANLPTEEALNQTICYIENYISLREKGKEALKLAEIRLDKTAEIISSIIDMIL